MLAWAKKRKRFIKREDLIAFLTDKPEPTMPQPNSVDNASSRMEDEHTMPVSSPVSALSSPRRRLLCKEELPSEADMFAQRDMGRKRQNSFFDMTGINASLGATLGCSNSSEFGPLMKRIKL